MQYKDLKFQVKDHVAIITLDRPKYRNAFSPKMLESWVHALDVSEKTRMFVQLSLPVVTNVFAQEGM